MKRLYEIISQLFSFEALLVLYLFAGIYKSGDALKQYATVVDPTLLFFLASFAVGVGIFIKQGIKLEKDTINILFVFVIFIIYSGLSLSWSQSSQYGVTKCLYLGILNFWNLIGACLIIAPDVRRIRRFMFLILAFSLIYAAISLPLAMDLGRNQPIELTGSDYQGTAFIFCIGLMVIICFLIDSSQSKLIRVGCFLISCIYLWILLFVGDRGFLIASFVAIFLLFFLNPLPAEVKRKIYIGKRYVVLLVIIFISLISVLQIAGKTPATLSRLMVLSAPTSHSSHGARVSFYKAGFEIWNQHLIWGSGIGSFPVISGAGDTRGYPHNLIVELLVELGLVGLCIYALFLFMAVKLILKNNLFESYPAVLFTFLLFILCLFEAMISGDISDHRFLMVSVGLMAMPRHVSRQVSDGPQANMGRGPGSLNATNVRVARL